MRNFTSLGCGLLCALLIAALSSSKAVELTTVQLQHYQQPYVKTAETAIKRQNKLDFINNILRKTASAEKQRLLTAEFINLLELYRAHLKSIKLSLEKQDNEFKQQSQSLIDEALMTLKHLESHQSTNFVAANEASLVTTAEKCHRQLSTIENLLYANTTSSDMSEYEMSTEPVASIAVIKPVKGESLPIRLKKKQESSDALETYYPPSIPMMIVNLTPSSDSFADER